MNFIAYLRVSTEQQALSGAGLDAQRMMLVSVLQDRSLAFIAMKVLAERLESTNVRRCWMRLHS